MSNTLGAMAPPGLEWQIGKTAGSIVASNLVDELLQDETCREYHPALELFQQEIRSGMMVYQYIPNRENVMDTMKLLGKTKTKVSGWALQELVPKEE